MKKSILTSIAVVATTATALVVLSACGTSASAAALKSTQQSIDRTQSVMKSVDGIEMVGDHTELCKTLCAIEERNTTIAERKAEITALNAETKELKHQLRARKGKKLSAETYGDIRMQSLEVRRNTERLHTKRNDVKELVKTRHQPSDKIQINSLNGRYERVLQRLDQKIELLDKTKADIETLNKKLRRALNIAEPVIETPAPVQEVKSAPTPTQTQEFYFERPAMPTGGGVRVQRLPFYFM